MATYNGLESLKKNTEFLRKNNIDFYILDYMIVDELANEDYIEVWEKVKDSLPYNSFFIEMSFERAAVIVPGLSASETEALLKQSSEIKVKKGSVSLKGKIYKDITDSLTLEGVIGETGEPELPPESGEQGDNEVTPSAGSSKKLNISILDDDEIIRMFLGDQLDSVDWGEWVIDLEVYREGETFLNSGRLDVEGKHIIVLDGIMPRMDGMEVLSEIRKSHSENEVSIIMLTSRNRENDIVSAFEAGAFDYVTKPFKINELIARIKRVAKRMEQADA